MGYDIDLPAAGLLHDLKDLLPQDQSVVLHGPPGLLMSVVYLCAVSHKLSGNPPPVIEIVEIPETNAVNQEQRVFCAADLMFHPHIVQADLTGVVVNLLSCKPPHVQGQS